MNAQYGSPQLTRQALTTLHPFAASQLRDQPRSAISIQSAYADAAIRAQQGQQIFTGGVVPSTQTTDGVIVALCDTKVFNKLSLRVNAVRLEAVCQCKNRPVNGLKTKQCEQGIRAGLLQLESSKLCQYCHSFKMSGRTSKLSGN